MSDARALDALAAESGCSWGVPTPPHPGELGSLTTTRATRPVAPATSPAEALVPGKGEAVLATWHHLLDLGSLTDGDEYLLGTARTPVPGSPRSPRRARRVGGRPGDRQHRAGSDHPAGRDHRPARRVVWLPMNSPGSAVLRSLA